MKLFQYLLLGTLFFPTVSFATVETERCSSEEYTIATINGVLTGDDGARDNMTALKDKVGILHLGQKINYEYLLNPIHSGGFGDLLNSVAQKAFENEVVADYDLIEMLKDASQKVKTQKLLLVAHSQGNFYANSFYDVVAGQTGGVPAKSIGVYGVANPASRVGGEGKWLTSDTDKVITWVVGNVPFRKIRTPNAHIALGPGDDIMGHDFALVYLPHVGGQIVKDIEESLSNLSENTIQNNSAPCISPPKISLSHKQQGAIYAVTDPVLNPIGGGALWALGKGVNGAMLAYNTGVNVASTVTQTVYAVSSSVYNAILAALSSGTVAGNNSAMAILAAQQAQNVAPENNPVVITTNSTPQTTQPTTVAANASQKPQTVFVFEPKVQSGTDAPKLVFVGSFGSGLAQVMGSQMTASDAEEIVFVVEEVGDAGAGLPAPAISAPQCAQTLATDGCLLATTTVHFEWTAVFGADHYLLGKNGSYSTTTETVLDIEIKDFSDYTMEVVAVTPNGQSSATSTQAVSVATIPIAINEIAWMGTKANTSDEWFEIKNNTGHTIDLSQWELNAKDGTPHVKLAGTIAPRAYLIFERTDDTAVKDVDMHQKFTGELENNGDQLTLSYASTTMDQTPNGAWSAGATSTRQTMERYSSRESGTDPENWGTNLGYIKNGTDANGNAIEGTPGSQNSVSTLINKGQDITSDFTLTADEERYVIPSGVFVGASSTLTIEPGVTISFLNDNQENYGYFVVKGEIVANGTEKDPVVFNSFLDNRAGGFWIDNSTGTSTFVDSHFEDINNPVVIMSGNLEIKDSQFVNTDGGVESYGADTTVLIENTHFASSTSDTIGAYSSNVRISSSTITNQLDGDAIGLYSGSSLVVASTTIDGVLDGSGIYSYDSTLNISSSTIRNTEGTAISLAYSTSTISNTVVQGGELNDSTIGIEVYNGTATITDTSVSGFTEEPGISVYKPTLPVAISSGEITGNAIGVEMDSADSVIMTNVSIHDNGMSEVDNVFIWPPTKPTKGSPM